ncbi:pentapeptide repeat-containing protein [Oscillatoria sp. FACHB-1407]|uniref:pentapeptide repeat-containing protein n=1 Tax=Oscillatoria sp. FACHB-1407 TaxID=2692847 RepID=UPI001687D7D2|nr:pentapeptide repeat-containing protein [Oscillatoria sp. FACHB-1407]MBD2462977.1 pentapeptide repeat-containing protein [Oscillatoria sp. FACHB-1407]
MVKQLWRDIWQTLNTDITFSLSDTVSGAVDTSKSILELAKALQENSSAPEVARLISSSNISSLLDVLNSPLAQVAGAGLPFVPLATSLLKYIYEQTRQEPSLEVGVAIASQSAYLKSLEVFLTEHPDIAQRLSDQPASDALAKRIRQLGDKLELEGRAVELTEQKARETLICFHDSDLAKIFNSLLSSRLQEAGLPPQEAACVTERISRSTHRYMKTIVAEVQDQVKRLAAVYGEGWLQDQESYISIDRYLKEWIAQKPQEKIFDEDFCFADLYVPLEIKPVDGEGRVNDEAEPENIETWAEALLLNPDKKGQILFIQGGPGRGKSVFCRMFADKVRRDLYPIWIPILIRLRDVRNFAQDFDKTLADAIGTDFTKDPGWLTDPNTRFLFFLDGFDELLLERGATVGLQQFLDQVSLFQTRCSQNSERSHRVLITGRPLALYGIERLMPPNLERVEIQPMADQIQQGWLQRWSIVLADAEKAQQFQAFLNNQRCPKQVKTLATEPLLLYLLAALHRDGKLQESQFEGDDPVAVRIQIYEAALDWVLTKQRSDNGRDLNPKITGLDPEDLRSILAEAGLCVVQSGGESAAIALIEERLKRKEDEGAKALLDSARQQAEQNPLKNALAAFYLKSVEGRDNQVEFFHKSFGEFLCAERLCESLENWTEKSGSRRKNYTISNQNLPWEIYDLFGFGALTQEIVEYLMGLLKQKDSFDWVVLFERLEDFYLRWCDGEFIDDTGETLPQRKAKQLYKYQIQAGQRSVDVYTGLNTLILLLEIHRHAQSQASLKEQIQFYPCGQPDTESHQPERLLQIMHYSDCVKLDIFNKTVRTLLRNTNLSNVNLRNADLFSANLSDANLSNADLSSAYLSSTNLSNADLNSAYLSNTILSGTNLSNANLRNADLRNADLFSANLFNTSLSDANLNSTNLNSTYLRNANLRNANLSADLVNADLSSADLSSANLSSANLIRAYLQDTNLSEIRWDGATRWAGAQGLHQALNVPEALAQSPRFQAAVLLSQGMDWVKQGRVTEAVQAYHEAQAIDPGLEIDDWIWNELCQFGSLHGQAATVLFAGDKAVGLDNWWSYRESRGLARALTGNIAGAAEDFQAVVESDRNYSSDKRKQQQQTWLEALQAGQNPFTAEVLAELRKEAGIDQ